MPDRRPGPVEFIALIALIIATTAFSIDAMLPAMPRIAAELSPDAPNRAQLVVIAFVLGMGVGTMFTGALADAFGRRRVILWGYAAFALAALACWIAPTLETLLAARLAQGLAAAGPRVAAMAIIRDLYSGRQMARILSLTLIVFSIVPALAPAMSAAFMEAFGWRSIYLAFVAFAAVISIWYAARLGETLDPAHRRALGFLKFRQGVMEVLSIPVVRLTIIVQSLVFAILFATLASTQYVFETTFARAETFPYWFGAVAIVSASAAVLNARIVERLGMRRVVVAAISMQILAAGFFVVLNYAGWPKGDVAFYLYVFWMVTIFFMVGLCIGNLNAIAMEPLGHIAGMGASVTSSVATVAGALIATPIGLTFDGTPLPVAVGIFVFAVLAFMIMRRVGPDPQAQAPA